MSDLKLNGFHRYLRTTKDAGEFMTTLGKLQADIFRSKATFTETLDRDVPYDLGMSLKKLADVKQVNLNDKSQAEKFLAALRENVSTLPVVSLTLPFAPKKLFIENISDWFFTNFEKVVLLDISVNSALIGGGVVRYNGIQKDYSLRKQILGG